MTTLSLYLKYSLKIYADLTTDNIISIMTWVLETRSIVKQKSK